MSGSLRTSSGRTGRSGSLQNEWIVCPPAFNAATPVGARTIKGFSGNRARSSRMNVDFPVPAPPVTNTICFPRPTASNADCNSRLISIGSGARFFASRRRGAVSTRDGRHEGRRERSGSSIRSGTPTRRHLLRAAGTSCGHASPDRAPPGSAATSPWPPRPSRSTHRKSRSRVSRLFVPRLQLSPEATDSKVSLWIPRAKQRLP